MWSELQVLIIQNLRDCGDSEQGRAAKPGCDYFFFGSDLYS